LISRTPPRQLKRLLAVGVVLAAAAASIGATLITDGSGAATRPAASPPKKPKPKPPAVKTDTHGYPRTYNLYSGGTVDELARYDMVVGSKGLPVASLRLRNPSGVYLLQPSLPGSSGTGYVHVTAPGGAVGWPGATDTFQGGPNLGKIPAPNPDRDFLHNADGSISSIGKVLGWNLAAPPSYGVPTEVAKAFAYGAKRDGLYACTVRVGPPGKKTRVPCWSGVHSDNWIYTAIGAGWFYGPNLDADRDGKVDNEDALRHAWADGLTRVGTLLRTYLPGMVVGGNGAWYRTDRYTGSDPKGWLKASNYTLVEDVENYSPTSILGSATTWLKFRDPLKQPRYLAILQTATDANGKVLVWTQGNCNTAAAMQRPDVLRSMRWGLTFSMLSGAYYELIGNWYGNSHDCRWWFDEYDGGEGIRKRGYLGQPLGPYKKLSNDVYRRDFQNGVAINNSSSQAQTINLGGTFRKIKGTQDPSLNDGSTVTSVTIPEDDGIILLRA
jgi:hypothetical protein